jgi:photosystem II stability/assembly factor-like uncharacterized protein
LRALLFVALLHCVGASAGAATASVARAGSPAAAPRYGQWPFFFESNVGQADGSILFVARARDHAVYLTPRGAILALADRSGQEARSPRARSASAPRSDQQVELSFPGSQSQPLPRGVDPGGSQVHYLIGSDPDQWHRAVPTFARVRYEGVYPGVDLVYYGNERELEFDWIVAPGADPRGIAMHFQGGSALELDRQGDLIVPVGQSRLRQHRPVAYQVIHGVRREVSARYELKEALTVGFVVGPYDPHWPLIVDPVLSYSTYLGGDRADVGWSIVADPSGNAYIAGDTLSIFKKLPLSGFQTNFGGGTRYGGDAFIAKLDDSGTNLFYLTYLGGAGLDGAVGLAVDSSGAAYVTGYTDSPDFPLAGVSGILQTNIAGTNDPVFKAYQPDAFVAKLDPSGSNLVYSTYLGGEQSDTGIDIAVDPAGAAYVVGYTESALVYWITNQVETRRCTNGVCGSAKEDVGPNTSRLLIPTQMGTNLVKVKINTNTPPFYTNTIEMIFTTNLVYARQTTVGFPLVNPVQTNGAGLQDLFVCKISPDGSQLLYSTYLGGLENDFGTGVAVDGAGNATLSGWTESGNFPVTNAIQPVLGGGRDALVAKFDPGGALLYSTYLGGLHNDAAYRVAVDPAGNAYVVGSEGSADFPSTPGPRLKGGVFRSLDGGASWSLMSSGLTHTVINTLLSDPATPGLLYAGTPRGVYKSLDSGANWFGSSTGLANRAISSLNFHASASTTIFAGTSGGFFRSQDAAGSWTNIAVGLGSGIVNAMLFDPGTPTTISAGTASGFYKSVDDSTNWVALNKGLGNKNVLGLVRDPLDPALIYAATAGGVYRSTNYGTNWKSSSSGLSTHRTQAIAIDPTNSLLLYAGTSKGFYKTVNGATNWTIFTNGINKPSINTLLVDPALPSTLYAGTTNGLFKSLDSGSNWSLSQTNLDARDISLLSFGGSSAVLYAATRATNYAGGSNDAFVVKLVADGSAFAYAFTIGGTKNDEAWDVALDSSGNAFVAGNTSSKKFPTTGSTDKTQTNLIGKTDAFVMQVDPTGVSNVFSIYLGGKGNDIAHGLSLDGAGGIYLIGQTASSHFPVTNALQAKYASGHHDAFVLKLVPDAPSLRVVRANGALTLRWPVCPTVYDVESAENSLGPWTRLPFAPTVKNGQNTVVVPPSSEARFFRLRCR